MSTSILQKIKKYKIKEIQNLKENFGIEEIYQLYKKRKRLFDMNKNIKRNEGGSLNKGQKIWRRAKSIIPGGNMLLSKRPEMYAPDQWPSYYKKAKGCSVWDMENKIKS